MPLFNLNIFFQPVLGMIGLLFLAGSVKAEHIHVMASTALKPVLEKLAPAFEEESGHQLTFSWGASYGTGNTDLPGRLQRGEAADVVIMVRESVDEQVKQGYLLDTSIRDLATSQIGLAIKPGSTVPDISTTEALKAALLKTRNVAFSAGISGRHISQVVFPQLGISDSMREKSLVIHAPELVGHAIMRDDAEIGIQQMSELLAVQGIQIVGTLPIALQKINTITAAITHNTEQSVAAQRFIRFLTMQDTAPYWKDAGFSPVLLP